MTSAREVALETLIKVLGSNNSYSNIALNNSLEKANLSERDSALTTNIVYGTIQYKIFLEYQLQPLIKTKLVDYYLEPLLLMSAYQYFFLDKVPTNAIFDEANKLAKKYSKKGRGAGSYRLVNGILRSLDRQGKILPDTNDTLKYISIRYSYPEWLVSYLIEQFGIDKTKKILDSSNYPAKNSIRVIDDIEKVKDELRNLDFDFEESPLSSDCLFLDHGGIARTELFKSGQVTIQDSAASLAVEAFNFNGNEDVLDACAAPGGKTVQIAQKLTTGKVTALDIHENKLRLVKNVGKRLHVIDKIKTKALDARKAPDCFSAEQFDKILVDAPCSGLGLIRRKPEIRYEKSLKDIERLSQIQLDILDQVCSLVAKNGELVYSTCTISKKENEEVIEKFLTNHSDFSIEPIKVGNLAKSNTVRIFPDEYQSDGFFIAKFIKRG